MGKDDRTTGLAQQEYLFVFMSNLLTFACFDNSAAATRGRRHNTSLSSDLNAWHCYTATKSTETTCAACKIYRDGVQIDDTNYTSATYTAMENKSAPVGSYFRYMDGAILSPMDGKQGVVLIVAEELTAVQVARLDVVLRAYAGVSL